MSFSHESRVTFILAACASYILHAAVDSVIHQLILSFVLWIFSESISLRHRIFTTGIVVLCFAFSRLYGLGAWRVSLTAEKFLLTRAVTLITFLTVLFAFTSDEYVPLFAVLLTLVLFIAVNVSIRRSIRSFMGA